MSPSRESTPSSAFSLETIAHERRRCPVPTYATYQDLADYLTDSNITAPAEDAGDRLLGRCEYEVDTLLAGFGAPYDDTGLKYDPATDLTTTEANALRRAVCAQAEYHLVMGDEFFVKHQYDSWQGPDFAAKGVLGYFGPKVAMELSGQGLARTPGVASVSTTYLGSQSTRFGVSNVRAN